MYHRIVPKTEAGGSNSALVVPPDRFSAQLDALHYDGWQTITLASLADDLEAGIRPPDKTFVITIDDGWYDGYTYALPILESFGYVATYFVIADRIDGQGFLSAAQIRALDSAGMEIGNHTADHVNLNGGTTPRRAYEIATGSATIARIIGHWPETLSYPAGRYSSAGIKSVMECHSIKLAVIEGFGTWETWGTRFQIPRLKVYPGTTPSNLLSWVTNPARPRPSSAPTSLGSAPAPGTAAP
jgi:peptidoglycan/xylan/chitin deacetylase (PgdA/CDA1 family)